MSERNQINATYPLPDGLIHLTIATADPLPAAMWPLLTDLFVAAAALSDELTERVQPEKTDGPDDGGGSDD